MCEHKYTKNETFTTSYPKVQPWKLGKKYDGNFIFTFAVVKVRYGGKNF